MQVGFGTSLGIESAQIPRDLRMSQFSRSCPAVGRGSSRMSESSPLTQRAQLGPVARVASTDLGP